MCQEPLELAEQEQQQQQQQQQQQEEEGESSAMDVVITLCCRNRFHHKCLVGWVCHCRRHDGSDGGTCPLCRHPNPLGSGAVGPVDDASDAASRARALRDGLGNRTMSGAGLPEWVQRAYLERNAQQQRRQQQQQQMQMQAEVFRRFAADRSERLTERAVGAAAAEAPVVGGRRERRGRGLTGALLPTHQETAARNRAQQRTERSRQRRHQQPPRAAQQQQQQRRQQSNMSRASGRGRR